MAPAEAFAQPLTDGNFVEEPLVPQLCSSYPPRHHLYTVPEVSTYSRGEMEPPASVLSWVPAVSGNEAGFYARPSSRELPTKASEHLPLELFDNPEFEPIPPEQLILQEDGQPGAAARSRYFTQDGQFTWAPCSVMAYDAHDNLFTIRWAESGVEKRVKRLNVIFDSEDAARFELRVASARARAAEAEDALRFMKAADRVKLSEGAVHYLDGRWEAAVSARTGPLAWSWPAVLENVFSEAREDYDAAVKMAVLEHSLERPGATARVTAAPGLRPMRVLPPVPDTGCVPLAGIEPGVEVHSHRRVQTLYLPIPREPIEEVFDVIEVLLPVARPDIVKAREDLVALLNIEQFVLADCAMPNLRRPATLEDFVAVQAAASARCSDKLHNEWFPQSINLCERIVPDAVGGRFHDTGTRPVSAAPGRPDTGATEVTLASVALTDATRGELNVVIGRRFARLASLLMTDILRAAVTSTAEAYADAWRAYDMPEVADVPADDPEAEAAAAAAAEAEAAAEAAAAAAE